MSLTGFDGLRAEYPTQADLLMRLEETLRVTLTRDVNAVIEDERLAQLLRADVRKTREFLVELVALHALQTLLLWDCPNGFGTILERMRADEFPSVIECDRCGYTHEFRARDVCVVFVASPELRAQMRK
jgi:hypothetical protein